MSTRKVPTAATRNNNANQQAATHSDRLEFEKRLGNELPRLEALLQTLYPQASQTALVSEVVEALAEGFEQRSSAMKEKDRQRVITPDWFRDQSLVGMACYVDLMAEDLQGMREKIPYLKDLGITYLHLMPLFDCPTGDNDGGYAVSNYRAVRPDLGSTDDLRTLASDLSDAGITLALDFILNHTSDEHPWAQAAKAGDEDFRNFYYIFPNREEPDRYETTLREIFPQVRRGSFTYIDDIDRWVWTTFNSFQWDLNYSNPKVFVAIIQEMLYLANIGADVLRLDAVAFIWKELGTNCENQPNAHRLIQALNACLQITAPSVVFKSEAIVHPDDVNRYIDPEECQLSYNPLLMALIWNSLATRKTRLLTHSMAGRFAINEHCAWVNYARCHDDIGWTFDDGDAASLHINAYDHRHFLNRFYTGDFEGSFANGIGFQYNPENGDCRVCGSLASLAGLEHAVTSQDEYQIEMAVRRIFLIHSILLTIGGIPLLYAGDEIALLNDYGYQDSDEKKHDARWVNRPRITAEHMAEAKQPGSIAGRVQTGLQQLIQLRSSLPVLGNASTRFLHTGNDHLFAFLREHPKQDSLLVLANFSEHPQSFDPTALSAGEIDTFEPITHRELSQNALPTIDACRASWIRLP